MALVDLANIPYEPFACVHTAIGELCLFNISSGNEEELYKELGKLSDEYETNDFIKKFVGYVCYPKDSLREGINKKPDKPLLTDEVISSLTGDELEAIAEIYIENNEYLFKKSIYKEEINDQGITVVSYEYGEIEYPINKDESYTQYLLRLYIEKYRKYKKQTEQMLSGIGSFSSGLETSIKNTLSWGDSLRKTMQSIRPAHVISVIPVEQMPPTFDFVAPERARGERRLQPFNELSERLDQLIGISTQSTKFMIKGNEDQIRIGRELKSAGDETTKFSKRNIWLTIIVIVLSIFTILKACNDSNIQRVQSQESVNLLAGKLTDINNSIAGANDLLKIENERLKEQTAKQAKMIDEMKIMIGRQGKKLEELEKRN